MIRTLQKRFVLTAMAAITVLLLVALGAVNGLNAWAAARQNQALLTALAHQLPPPTDADAQPAPALPGPPEALESPDTLKILEAPELPELPEVPDKPFKGPWGRGLWDPPFEQEAALAARGFSVLLSREGQPVQLDLSRTAAVEEADALLLAQQALDKAGGGAAVLATAAATAPALTADRPATAPTPAADPPADAATSNGGATPTPDGPDGAAPGADPSADTVRDPDRPADAAPGAELPNATPPTTRQSADPTLQGAVRGRVGRFCFLLLALPQGRGIHAVFLDTALQRRAALTVLAFSAAIGLACWLCMLVLVAALSRRAIRPIARSMERQKQFITDAGHEIKTPLAAMLANTDALELHTGPTRWSRNLRAQLQRLTSLTQDLLALARMDEGAVAPAVPVDLPALCRQTVENFAGAAAARRLQMTLQLPDALTLPGDPQALTRLLTLLLDNAVRYADEGGNILLCLQKGDKAARLQLRNSCAALPTVEPQKLFDRFYRGDAARTADGGFGIGLATALAIAQALGGSLQAAYAPDPAVTFTLQLPLHPARARR